MAEFKVGDELVIQGTGRYRRERFRGAVTRIARKYAFAEFEETWTASGGEEQHRLREIAFDMESGNQRGSNEFYVRTVEQVERADRKRAAISVLKDAGLEFKLGHEHFFTLEQVEALAEVVKGWEE